MTAQSLSFGVYFMNDAEAPDKGQPWCNALGFRTEECARAAAKALADSGVTDMAVVLISDKSDEDPVRIAQIEYTRDHELVVFDRRQPSLFELSAWPKPERTP